MLHLNFILSLTGYCKRFYRIHLFPIFLLFDLFCIYYWDWQDQKCKLKCLKVYEINSELYCNCNCCLNPFLWYKHHYRKTSQECIIISIISEWSLSEIKKFFHLDRKEISTLKHVIGYIIFNKTVCCDSSFLLDSFPKENIFPNYSAGNRFLFLNRFWYIRFSGRLMFFLVDCVLINLKYMTVTWLFKMAKLM